MPLNTFSNEEEQRFLADGIAEDIITQLARNSELTVMPRTASFAFKDKGLSATEITSKLDVHYILEGSVRRVGEQLRITAQLIDLKSGNHVWAEHFDSAAASIFLDPGRYRRENRWDPILRDTRDRKNRDIAALTEHP